MKQVRLESTLNKYLEYNNVQKVGSDVYIQKGPKYPSSGAFALDENANVTGIINQDDPLSRLLELWHGGKIRAFGFKLQDGKYYAIDLLTRTNPEVSSYTGWGPDGLVNNVMTTENMEVAITDFNGEQNTTEIINQLGSDTLAGLCREKTFNGKQGFLPSIGQLNSFFTGYEDKSGEKVNYSKPLMSLLGYLQATPPIILYSSTIVSETKVWIKNRHYDCYTQTRKPSNGTPIYSWVFYNLD